MRKTCPDHTISMILARYRSGSNLINESFKQVPEVKVMGELFNLVNIERNPQKYLDPTFLRETFSIHREEFRKAVIFKLMYGQTSRDELEEANWGPNVPPSIINRIKNINAWLSKEYLPVSAFEHLLDQIKRDKEIRIIHLVRSNQLESFVSLQLALREDNWIEVAYKISPNGLTIDIKELERYFKNGEILYKYYKNLFQHHDMLEITYQDIAFNYEITFGKVLSFLNLRIEKPPVIPISKQNTREMSAVVNNYDTIYKYFKDTRWGVYFTEAAV